MDPKSLDYKSIIAAAIISGGLGVGGGAFTNADDVGEQEFHDFEVRFEQVEARSEKRYKRGMVKGKELEERGIKLMEIVTQLRIDNARLNQRIDDMEKPPKCK